MKKMLLAMLAAVVLLGLCGICSAQDSAQTIVTVAFSGYDELKANLDFLGKLIGRPDLAQGAEGMLKIALMPQGEGLAGLDTKRPWGAVVQSQGPQFPIVGFVPVSDLKKLLGGLIKSGLAKDIGGGVLQIPTAAQPAYVQQKGGWAFVSITPEALKQTPADPAALLGDLPKNYDLAVRASIKNLPEPLRQQFLAGLQMGVQMAARRRPDESEDAYALRSRMTQHSIEQVVALTKELDEVLLGWKINRQGGTTYIDVTVTARPGTKAAAQFAQLSQTKTNLAGFDIPEAAVTANWAGTIGDAEAAQLKGYLSNIRAKATAGLKQQNLGEAELKTATLMLGDFMDVVQKTIENKKADAGAVLLLKPDAATLVAGSLVADGAKLQKIVQQLAAEATANEPDVAKLVKLDAEIHQDVHFHTVSVPVPDPEAVKFLGPMAKVVLGISDQAVYVAGGRDAAKTLKQVIDQSKAQPAKPVVPLKIVVAATPIAEFVAAVARKDQVKQIAAQMAVLLKQSSGRADHLTLTVSPVPNGSRTRIEVEQDLLRVLPALAPMPLPGPGGPGVPPGAAPPR